MALSLKETNGLAALAEVLKTFLPGSGARHWRGHVNFGTVAKQVGVERFWPDQSGGSKGRRLRTLLEQTFAYEGGRLFERLVVEIVRAGLTYRRTSNDGPITDAEIRLVNGHLLELGRKFPSLWDSSFHDAVKQDDVARARRNVEVAETEAELASSARVSLVSQLDGLKTVLTEVHSMEDRHAAGYALERLLNDLFRLSGLDPREPFKLIGEQIDGSFVLGEEVYLIEAKWEKAPLPERELLVFQGKVKAPFGRGVFVAMNGITEEAALAIRSRNNPNFFVVTGHDLFSVLQGAMSLPEFLRRRWRLFIEEGHVNAPFQRVHAAWKAK